ncbi:MAG: YggT family protein [Mogibacterium sp.]|nr:YggT family protein [Mogibacterium sp.]
MVSVLVRAIAWFANLITTCMFVQALLSWFVRDYNSPVAQLYRLLSNLTAPIVEPVRRFMSRINTGPMDFSILVSMLLVEFVARLLIRLIYIIL